ncbi:MAG TPA: L,D-transpeptidase family protein [Steroidobacteraceae bacterium]|nr:L,D-transpeptidase family protein [Steroidobacteraceae bacterium]
MLAVWSIEGHAAVFELPADGSAVIGEDTTLVTHYQDTLLDIARKYSLGYDEIIRANPGVVSIGKLGRTTPLGETRVIAKVEHPSWYPPASIRAEHAQAGDPLPAVVGPGPDNPLGEFKIRLGFGDGTYEIHGTNNPTAVGLAVTHGCIRMYPEDVAQLFPRLPVGTPVRLINVPVKVAWVDGELLLEAHPPVDAQGESFEPDVDRFSSLLRVAVGDTTVAIYWDYARQVLQKADGVIATVGLEADDPSAAPPEAGAPQPVTAAE